MCKVAELRDAIDTNHLTCFGSYMDSGDCRSCWQSPLCKEEAQRLDGYWDEMARFEWELITSGVWEEV